MLRALDATRSARLAPAATITVDRGQTLVHAAFHVQLAKRTCLPQAVVQYVLHRRFGPPPKLVIGVSRSHARPGDPPVFGLDAHAWVEPQDGPPAPEPYRPILTFTDATGISRGPWEDPSE